MDDREVVARRLSAQALAGKPLAGPVAVVERLLAVQGQDPRGFRLAVRARTRGLSAADVEAELSERRSLVVSWLNRGTLHLVSRDDYWWLHSLTTPTLATAARRRLRQEGVSEAAAERAVAEIEAALADEGPLTRPQLRDRLDAAGVPTEGQALVHLLFLASLSGIVVRGPMIGRQHAFALAHDWLGPQPEVDRDRALAELARRYLAGHAPATDRDLAKWAGLPLREARSGLTAIASQLEQLEGGMLRLKGTRRSVRAHAPRLLGAFDPVLHGWASRRAILGRYEPRLVSGGVFRPFALVDGRAVGRWSWSHGRAEIEPFEPLADEVRGALDADAADVDRFLAGRPPRQASPTG